MFKILGILKMYDRKFPDIDMLPFRWTVEIIKLFNWRGVLSCLEEYYQK